MDYKKKTKSIISPFLYIIFCVLSYIFFLLLLLFCFGVRNWTEMTQNWYKLLSLSHYSSFLFCMKLYNDVKSGIHFFLVHFFHSLFWIKLIIFPSNFTSFHNLMWILLGPHIHFLSIFLYMMPLFFVFILLNSLTLTVWIHTRTKSHWW